MNVQVTDHTFEANDLGWCQAIIGSYWMRAAEYPMGALMAHVPKRCNLDREDHVDQGTAEEALQIMPEEVDTP
jgi:hypothetical protein